MPVATVSNQHYSLLRTMPDRCTRKAQYCSEYESVLLRVSKSAASQNAFVEYPVTLRRHSCLGHYRRLHQRQPDVYRFACLNSFARQLLPLYRHTNEGHRLFLQHFPPPHHKHQPSLRRHRQQRINLAQEY